VLGFLKPPGAGVDGVPLQQLFAFERVHLRAGESKLVSLYPSLLDFTTVTNLGDAGATTGVRRSALPGRYRFVFGVAETHRFGMGYTEHSVETV
jgi:beta-D-xylosidase 4